MKIETLTPQIAAMYWGQTCEITSVPEWYHRTLNPTEKVGEIKKLDFSLLHGMFHPNGLSFIPHLRPLSSLTEDEARELYEIKTGRKWYSSEKCLERYFNIEDDWLETELYQCIGAPHIWIYLLSLGFDLFGLIDAGLAKEITN